MRFLITNIGNEDIVLGYPWLALYKPKFSWKHATIDEAILPIVLRSVNPQIPHKLIHQCFDRSLDPPWTSLGQLGPAGASWYNTLKLASCHVHRPCPNPLQSPHRAMTSK